MIVVTTPTGQIGRLVLDRLLDSPDATPGIRVIARDPDRLPARVREHVEVVQGSHADPAVLKEACAGADRVFWLVPPMPSTDSVEDHFHAFTGALCEAIGSQGIERVVAVSSLGRGIAENAGQISASLAMDDTIAATGVHYRALCAPFLMENFLRHTESLATGGALPIALAPDRVLRTCAVADIATTAARLLLDTTWTGRADVPLVGPDDLTLEDMAQIIADVLDRPVHMKPVTSTDQKQMLLNRGMSEAWAQAYADMVNAQNDQGLYGATAPSTPEEAPTSFRQWCEEVLKPAVLA
ncbi:NAD(P)H-binding protein [Streptomyces sp. NPDC050211]|uniref:NAD(P)H-binding protein n=1 Tax=Streptomyces sp. NPDC050211 TaxID=3154932 RepID=UPI0034383D59